jgi:hypothetical protein
MDRETKHDRWWNSLSEWKRLTYMALQPGEPLEEWMVTDLRNAGFEPVRKTPKASGGADLYSMPEPPATYVEHWRAEQRGEIY